MVFNFNEAKGGLKHIGMGWRRAWSKQPADVFLPDYVARGILAKRFESRGEQLAICSICGYAMMRVELPNGWFFETCSAMPTVTGFESQEFSEWARSLSPAKLPTAHV